MRILFARSRRDRVSQVELGIAAAHLCSSTADIRSRALPVAGRHTPGPHRVDLSTILQGPCDDVRSSMLGSADDARNVDTAVRRVMGAKQKFHKLLCMLMLQFEEEAHEHSNHFVKEFAKTEARAHATHAACKNSACVRFRATPVTP